MSQLNNRDNSFMNLINNRVIDLLTLLNKFRIIELSSRVTDPMLTNHLNSIIIIEYSSRVTDHMLMNHLNNIIEHTFMNRLSSRIIINMHRISLDNRQFMNNKRELDFTQNHRRKSTLEI